MDRTMTLDALIKQINTNGGKTAPLVAESLSALNHRIKHVEKTIQSETLAQATGELYRASCEISSMRGQYKADRAVLKALTFGYVSGAICLIVYLAFGWYYGY